jgi:hypothetical protein
MSTSTPYTSPSFLGTAFNCPYCSAYARMLWFKLKYYSNGWYTSPIHMAYCTHCTKNSYWVEDPHPEDSDPASGRMLIPTGSIAPMPHPDMPEVVALDYEEARRISGESPRGAAALLRLAIQKLCVELGEKGKNINDDIGSLVEKGLPVEIRQALDIVRVIGNNAVHPGELSEDDVEDVSATLFELLNQIVEDRIARPKKLNELFQRLPPGAREAIEKRDKKSE